MLTLMRWAIRLFGVSALVLSAGFLVFAAVASQPAEPSPVADGIVALTGGEARIEEALRLLADHRAKRLLISGVNPHTTRTALERLSPEFVELFNCCIDIGHWAQDTIGNADEADTWVRQNGYRTVIVVTSGYHMARGMAELSRAMPGIGLIAHPVLASGQRADAWWTSPSATRLLLVEYFKLLPALARLGASRLLGEQPQDATAAIVLPSQVPNQATVN
jgi:uncharacterized SAM-binding protein YcdF (DUF218 family)